MNTLCNYTISHQRDASGRVPLSLSERVAPDGPGIHVRVFNPDLREKLIGLALILDDGEEIAPRLQQGGAYTLYGRVPPCGSATLEFAFDRLRPLRAPHVTSQEYVSRRIDQVELLIVDSLPEDGEHGSLEVVEVTTLGRESIRTPQTDPVLEHDRLISAYLELDTGGRREMKKRFRDLYWRTVYNDPPLARAYARAHRDLVAAWCETRPLYSRILGTHCIGSKYQFTSDPALLEQASRVLNEMGSDTLKFSLGGWGVAKTADVPESLVHLVRDNPTYREVLDLPFRNIMMWAYPLGYGKWGNWERAMTEAERRVIYGEIFELSLHLLSSYKGTGKTFFLGNWEGDWHYYNLEEGQQFREPSAQRARVMREWMCLRQQAVDDARRAVPEEGMRLFSYAEINHPVRGMLGRASAINDVIPYVDTDFLSYSSYDSTNAAPRDGDTAEYEQSIVEVLGYIEDRLPPRDIPGPRVWLGEYGYPANGFNDDRYAITPQIQDYKTRATIRAGLRYGCPFVLYWELYCNETRPDGTHNGFWLVDADNVAQPAYATHRSFLRAASGFEQEARSRGQYPPTLTDLLREAPSWIEPSTR